MKEDKFRSLVLRALVALSEQVLAPNSVVPEQARKVRSIQAELEAAIGEAWRKSEEGQKHAK